ncbi:helix-turn-helix transcriptional regulator [Nocardioides sp. W3-2-3]|uniref:helix-turn-helix domain-containing protein n=1 Tax=Nocardioides convexus TaxID=2712224 RepID=UPI002418804B|nr:helix-turn-helix transcriptional regulator [Nocardioides convexus]NHA00619.1 helix-turn-helix transcriptional regulator [Nocardioides convexus]
MPPPKQPPSPATVEFGKRVRQHREAQGLSQEMLADRCGVHWTFLGQVERGQRSIRLDNILKVAAGLGVEPGELVNGLPVKLVPFRSPRDRLVTWVPAVDGLTVARQVG